MSQRVHAEADAETSILHGAAQATASSPRQTPRLECAHDRMESQCSSWRAPWLQCRLSPAREREQLSNFRTRRRALPGGNASIRFSSESQPSDERAEIAIGAAAVRRALEALAVQKVQRSPWSKLDFRAGQKNRWGNPLRGQECQRHISSLRICRTPRAVPAVFLLP